ncbi:unnamed protein product [Schistosoma curassoni]|uniref:Uncharacterized protein n=1 Tax=Schistosoma curassoni TaxID=6186 RepID=A0A183KKH6_9TREM|nr:unnamed protein product [Schistosoma curassoni]
MPTVVMMMWKLMTKKERLKKKLVSESLLKMWMKMIVVSEVLKKGHTEYY